MALICAKHRTPFEIDPTDARRSPVLRCLTCIAEAKAKIKVEKVRYAVSRYGIETERKNGTSNL